jgi:PAS domain S-box-containing protein
MIEYSDKNDRSQQLRARAERQLKSESRIKETALVTLADDLIHDLQVHQIELEMQNEELRRAQVALEIAKAHYVTLYDFAPVGYLTLTNEGMISEMNFAVAKLLGGERNHLSHRRFAQFVADGHKDRWYQFLLQARQQGGSQHEELPIRRIDGNERLVRFDCVYQEVDEPRPLLRMALTDITERTLAEMELRESKARLALVVDEVNAGYWDWDLDTDTLYLSPEWKRQLGLDSIGFPSQWNQTEDRLHADDRIMVREATENFIAGRRPDYDLQFRLRHSDGTYRWMHCRGALVRDPNGRPIRMLGLNLDITDFKQGKELEARRSEMEREFRSKIATQTAATIAHELNQPLSAVSYFAYVAKMLLQSGNANPEKLSEIMEKCGQQAQRAGDVIKQLREILQKGEVSLGPVDLNASVKYSLAFVKAQGDWNSYDIRLELDEGLPPVTANQLQIQMVLANLLQNGLESMHESGIKTGILTISTCRSADFPGMAQVTVCDCGKRVACADDLQSLFQPIHTLNDKNFGLSLAVSQALIEDQGGKMWAEQNVGPGLSVHFTIPLVS